MEINMIGLLVLLALGTITLCFYFFYAEDLDDRIKEIQSFYYCNTLLPRLLEKLDSHSRKNDLIPEYKSLPRTGKSLHRINIERIYEGLDVELEQAIEIDKKLCDYGLIEKRGGGRAGGSFRRLNFQLYHNLSMFLSGKKELSEDDSFLREIEGPALDFLKIIEDFILLKRFEEYKSASHAAKEREHNRVIDGIIRIKDDDLDAILSKDLCLSEKEKVKSELLLQLELRDIIYRQTKGYKIVDVHKLKSFYFGERVHLLSSLFLGLLFVLPLVFLYLHPPLRSLMGKASVALAFFSGLVLSSYTEKYTKFQLQKSTLREAVLGNMSVQGNSLHPIFIGLLLGHRKYITRRGWSYPNPEASWPLNTIKYTHVLKLKVYSIVFSVVTLILIVYHLAGASNVGLFKGIKPFIPYYTLLTSVLLLNWTTRKLKLPVLRSKILIYQPSPDVSYDEFSTIFVAPDESKIMSANDLSGFSCDVDGFDLDKEIYLEVTATKSSYGFHNLDTKFALCQKWKKKINLDKSSPLFDLINSKFHLKRIKKQSAQENIKQIEEQVM
jgi:hypothetical protein